MLLLNQVFIPINIKEVHWYLAVVNAKKSQIQVLDSKGLSCRDDLAFVVSIFFLMLFRLRYICLKYNFDLMNVSYKLTVTRTPSTIRDSIRTCRYHILQVEGSKDYRVAYC